MGYRTATVASAELARFVPEPFATLDFRLQQTRWYVHNCTRANNDVTDGGVVQRMRRDMTAQLSSCRCSTTVIMHVYRTFQGVRHGLGSHHHHGHQRAGHQNPDHPREGRRGVRQSPDHSRRRRRRHGRSRLRRRSLHRGHQDRSRAAGCSEPCCSESSSRPTAAHTPAWKYQS